MRSRSASWPGSRRDADQRPTSSTAWYRWPSLRSDPGVGSADQLPQVVVGVVTTSRIGSVSSNGPDLRTRLVDVGFAALDGAAQNGPARASLTAP